MPLSIRNGQLVWLGNLINLANSVIAREATLGQDDAFRVIVSDRGVSTRQKVLAYLSIFPLLIEVAGDEDAPEGPTLEGVSIGVHTPHRGYALCLKSDKPLAISRNCDEGAVSLVLSSPDKIVLEVRSIYLEIQMPSPPDCAKCDCD